jgi:hypothetical protein
MYKNILTYEHCKETLQTKELIMIGLMSFCFVLVLSIPRNSHYEAHIALAQSETAPIANPGPDRTVHATDIITLDGNRSFDRDGDPIIKYHWEVSWPPKLFVGSTANFYGMSAEGKTVTVQIPNVNVPTDFRIALTVSDGKYNSNPPAILTLHALPNEPTR